MKKSKIVPQIVKVVSEHDGFKIGDKVRVTDEWAKEAKSHYAYIRGFQRNGGTAVFAKVEWAGPHAIELEKKFGRLFETKSLKRI